MSWGYKPEKARQTYLFVRDNAEPCHKVHILLTPDLVVKGTLILCTAIPIVLQLRVDQ